MRISDWSSDVCSSDLDELPRLQLAGEVRRARAPDAQLRPAGAVHRIYGARQRIDLRRIAADRQETEHRDDQLGLRRRQVADRSEEHTSELQSLMRNSYAVFCLKKKNTTITYTRT